MSRIPISTYRLQIRASFDLTAAAGVADYLAELGADWMYLSPILQAEEGSDHGYDVTDHARIDTSRGGPEGLAAAGAAARGAGLGVLIDVVPNHVGVATPRQSLWWWDLLTHGQESVHAAAFDVDWQLSSKVRVPILGDGDGELDVVEVDGATLRYYDHVLPIAPGTEGGTAREVLDRQHYELINWRRADSELNYRRFFAVNTLAAVKVELPAVFADSHAEVVRWITEGLADGLRIDHPDGLHEPAGYLDDLAAATGGVYVLVEKILEGEEPLPKEWATAGTTGYDALALLDRVLVQPAGEQELTAFDAANRGAVLPWADMIRGTKRAIADGILNSEVNRLARLIPQVDRGADAIAELLACFPVYRSYLSSSHDSPAEDARAAVLLREAVTAAKRYRPDLGNTLDEVAALLLEPGAEVARRFQQTSGMVMAKGVEDTAFYRYNRLTSLNEVGADPSEFAVSDRYFHDRQLVRQDEWPSTMTTLSTHDTKRSEDVRARLHVLAEIPGEWVAAVSEWSALAPLADPTFANLLWQAAVGAWPIERERLHAYAEKAAREAGDSTTWYDPDEVFEKQMHGLVDAIYDDQALNTSLVAFVERIRPSGWSNSLALKVLQIGGPGVPDVYQGTELWDHSLVDPDNRRPVDFARRRELLARIDAGWQPPIDIDGGAKLLVTSRALRLRRDRPGLFTGYRPLAAVGPAADHVLAFDRGGAIVVATRFPVGLEATGGWQDTTLALPPGDHQEMFTGSTFSGEIRLDELLRTYPVALLALQEDQ
ncbi:malto-oligosyltrehalose synthase [Nakamurella silvestris]|nr:malto-oligosyltrehalose synthase [Nakamurella silvestris]